ncbi:MAG: plastocyanin/azurin family copper-binding protein [Hylemonella sp.]
MTHKTRTLAKVMALMAIALSSSAFAGGNHAGGHGHGHDDEETAIGKPGVAARVNRTITIEMNDSMRYTPADVQVKQGETVRFVVKNVGKVKHELSLGTQQELMEHLEQMKKFPDMEHDEPSKVTLAPGKQGEIIWQFTKAGTVNFACLMPGHYEAGMKGAIKVARK